MKPILIFIKLAMFFLSWNIIAHSSQAQFRDWNTRWGDWSDPANWTPALLPGPTNIARIGNLPEAHTADLALDNNANILGLQIYNGMRLQTNGHPMVVIGDTLITGSSTRGSALQVQNNTFTTRDILNQRRLRIDSGVINVVRLLETDTNSVLFGGGVVNFLGDSGVVFRNDGRVSTNGSPMITLNQLGNGLMDLDGSTGDGRVRLVSLDGDMTVNGTELADGFSGSIQVSFGQTLDMNLSSGWTADANSEVELIGGPEPTSIQGTNWTFNGTMEVVSDTFQGPGDHQILAPTIVGSSAEIFIESENELEFDNTTLDGGTFSLEKDANLVFAGGTLIESANFSTFSNNSSDGAVELAGITIWEGPVNADGIIRQTGTSTVNGLSHVNTGVFDMDGNGGTHWNIHHVFSLNTTSVDSTISNSFDGTFNIAGIFGRLAVELEDPLARWTMAGEMNLNNLLPGTAVRLSGSPIDVTGNVNLLGGSIRVTSDMTFANSSVVDYTAPDIRLVTDATTEIAAGASFLGTGNLEVSTGGRLNLNDAVSLNNTRLENHGTLQIGNPTGIATVNEMQFGPESLWLVDISGDVIADEHDALQINGTAQLGGTLGVKLINSIAPEIGDQFTILVATGGIVGQFDNEPVSILNGTGYQWQVIYGTNDVTVELVSTIPDVYLGDVNLDGVVNLLDVAPFVALLTSGTYQLQADLNCDGVVDLLDVDPFVALLTGS